MNAIAAAANVEARARRRRRGRWLAGGAAAFVAACLCGIGSTHLALSAGPVSWTAPAIGSMPPPSSGIANQQPGYSQVIYTDRPGGTVTFGFDLHNDGLVPVTIVGLHLKSVPPGMAGAVAPAGARLGPDRWGRLTAFHPVAMGPGGSLAVGLTARAICVPIIRADARLHRGDYSYTGGATNPVIVRHRALGVTATQTISIPEPVLIVMPYSACA